MAAALPTVRARCEEIGRDPATLAISVHMWWDHIRSRGQQRVDRLAGFRELGVSRVMGLVRTMTTDDEALGRYIEDARAAGAEIGEAGRVDRPQPLGRLLREQVALGSRRAARSRP